MSQANLSIKADHNQNSCQEQNCPQCSPGPIILSAIKVREYAPVPKVADLKGDSFNDTIYLIDLVREQNQNKAREAKEKRIREMAMEQKKRQEEQKRGKRGGRLLIAV